MKQLMLCVIWLRGALSAESSSQSDSLFPYLYPQAHLGFIELSGVLELALPLWLVIRGWKIQEQPAES